ncbi:Permease of phosphate ABC transporter [Petrocella atlantisensis]|uniref:Permease of phosphate ABC transporter n=1 Tax=Petrocella atlantisensis TaxID=2173034 RepID=A0A3P7Q0Q9_9FIRM|nr:permease of phosphate ABC transporter [Petrocella atlantisensis]MCF8018720.1 permease of phosphate ABC transporter [Vallitaleaceae bacterium]PKM55092.1 MAG: permease of phosphate ABC transporter [Firmicutes bacterium HGW-Firmicutes-5]VDN48981.1 Permease of phosphate ABC transporter [Petrocella atlantisensis]
MKRCQECLEKCMSVTDTYMKESTWKDLALIKLCVFTVGMLMGFCVPKKHKTVYSIIGALIIGVTLTPIMMKFVPMLMDEFEDF